ncbi:PHP domain-containing protein [Paenibacillus elgii]|uniref:PHP domain-containing protein n=1 Tax=Paenibacillus elgii TaxID=189691 RepID=UPI000248CFA0|nr:PHP domain-containing protein [Paenibacillus elgii]
MSLIALHNHTDYSNLRLLDCTNDVKELIQKAADLKYGGLAITDHESVSAHVQAIKITRELKDKSKIPKDFKLILGNEIYLVEDLSEVRDNYKSGVTKFPHFILLSKDFAGHEMLRYLSSQAWNSGFHTGTMLRVPIEKCVLEEVILKNPNHLIASTACLGSEVNIALLEKREAIFKNDLEKAEKCDQRIDEFIQWGIKVFGRQNFYIEFQPAFSAEQIYCNKQLLKISEKYGLEYIITTDTHYLRPEDRIIHKAFLNAKDGDREIDDFYEATFLQTKEEIYERLNYFDQEIIDRAFCNTLKIGQMVEDYTIEHDTVIPKISLPEFKVRHIFKPAYDKYEYISKMAYADDEQDRYIIKLIEDGFDEHIPRNTLSREYFHKVLARINIELGELWEISQQLKQTMSSYYITTAKIVDIIWQDDECGGNSLVGSGRGSSGGFLICFLLGITQINPLDYGIEMPHWRHLHRSRPDIGALDIDIDTEGSKRPRIIQALKKYFGEDRVLQVCTFGTEGSKSAIQTACRGLGLDSDIGLFVSSLIPFERGENWTISDCLYGNVEKDREPIKEFINEIEKYEHLKETALKIEGKINKRSIHAGGVVVFNEPYYKSNAMMKAPNGLPITQFNLDDSQAVGNIKFDLLTIEALDKIRTELDLLLEFNEIEWQGSLRKTFNTYLHPNVIEKEHPKIFEMLGEGSVPDLFQFSTEIGYQSAIKVKPRNLLEVASANSLMRLMSEGGGEQPIDTFVRFKNDINLWYEEMRSFNLSEEEISILEEYLLKLNGIADTQETVMLLTMDERIAGFSVKEANKLRKTIAKKQAREEFEERKKEFYENGNKRGTSKNLLNYVWKQVERQRGYAFSVLHTMAYSIIALQELNLNYHYDPLYWNTAVLTVNSAGTEEEMNDDIEEDEEERKNKSTNYGKVASAIGMMKSHGVKIGLPDINKAQFGFKPDFEKRQIIYGLKGLVGIGDDVATQIVKHRPYNSFEDFVERMYTTGTVKKSQLLQLIKAGCFDSFGDRVELMKQFIASKIHAPKEKLTMQNFNMLIENNLIPEEHQLYQRLYKFRKYVTKKVYREENKNKLYKLDKISTDFYYEQFTSDGIVDYENGLPIISEKIFKKEYDSKMNGIKDWLQDEDTLSDVNQYLYEQEYQKNASGNISKWEMDSLSFYYTEHELKHIDKKMYGIQDFNSLSEEPVIIGHYTSKGKQRPKFKLTCIAGTVLDRNKNKHTVTLLTTDGVVTVKYYDGAFAHYNKQVSRPKADGSKEILEKSWFTRGNKLVIQGYRRGSQFKPHKYFDSKVKHTTMLITQVNEDRTILVKTERTR